MLTQGLGRPELQRSDVDGESGRRWRGGARGAGAGGYVGLLDPSRRRAEVLWSRNGGQRDPRTNGSEQLLGSEATCDGGIRGKNPGACRVETEVSWLEEVPSVEEKLL